MLFSSLTFLLLFLPICLFCYFIVRDIRIQNIILLIFSLIFYSWGEPIYVFLMLISISITYVFGIIIDRKKEEKKKRKFYFLFSILLLILSLLFFKYCNFIIQNINVLLKLNLSKLSLPLPIGISFYTFQALSYLIDLYKGKIKVQKNYLSLALYISLFPQLVAGPIVRYETIEAEIHKRGSTLEDVVLGFKRFILGLSKKVLFANSMALIADTIFEHYSQYGTFLLWLGGGAYTLQIYYDFSGYSDMAIGLGRVFGFHFLENFNHPYIATSITDFWRRWHISLSSWFRDYVYIPLGGSRVSTGKHIRNILVVWFLTGLWHGASWNYVLWGLYFACLLLIEKFLLKNKIEKIPLFIRHVITMIFVIVSWVIFRTESFQDLIPILTKMIVWSSSKSNFFYQHAYLFMSFYFILPAILFCIPFSFKKVNHPVLRNGVNLFYFILFVLDITFIIGSSYNPFIYFRF